MEFEGLPRGASLIQVCIFIKKSWKMIGNGKMPYGYVLKHLKLKDTPLYNEVVNARGNLDIKYIASNLAL